MKTTYSTLFVISLMFLACNIEIPTSKELKVKSSLESEVNKLIRENDSLFNDQYSIYSNANINYSKGEKTETHSIIFNCDNEYLTAIDVSKADSVSYELAKVILANIENDSSFNEIIIQMTKTENSSIVEKEWSYAKEFQIDDLKNKPWPFHKSLTQPKYNEAESDTN